MAYTTAFGDFNGWILDRGGTANLHNRLAAGQSWLVAHAATPQAAIDDTRNEVAAQTAASLAAVTSATYFAVDAQFMALPAFAMLGKLDSNTRYFHRIHQLYTYNKVTLGLYDTTARLYYRGDTSYIFPAKQTPNGKKLFWSRGNGWALAALARVLTETPLTYLARAEYVAAFNQMSGALKSVQRADGLWNMSLYDANHYPGPETSGTALFVYGMAWGINNGLLSRSTYGPVSRQSVEWHGACGRASGRQAWIRAGHWPGSGARAASDLRIDGRFWRRRPSARGQRSRPADRGRPTVRGGRPANHRYRRVTASRIPATTTRAAVKAADLGRWQLYTAGINVGTPQDAFGNAFTFTEVSLGDVIYDTSGKRVFRFTATGKNAASASYGTAIDYMMLTKQ